MRSCPDVTDCKPVWMSLRCTDAGTAGSCVWLPPGVTPPPDAELPPPPPPQPTSARTAKNAVAVTNRSMKTPLNHQACSTTIADRRAKRVACQAKLAGFLDVRAPPMVVPKRH